MAVHARSAAEADLAAVLVPVRDLPGRLFVAAADGVAAERLLGRVLPPEELAGLQIAEGADIAVSDATGTGSKGPLGLPAGPALLVRVPALEDDRDGVLALVRSAGGSSFGPEEQELATAYAGHAALAMQLAAAQESRRQLVVFDDRDRIAREMHDQVIQRLFATGLGMASLAGSCPDAPTRRRLQALTDEVDETIRTLRRTIFHLQGAAERRGLRAEVCALVRDLAPALGCVPDLRLVGPLDTAVDAELVEHAAAVLREALTNVARHARARSVRAEVELGFDGVLSITVTDDGVGLPRDGRRSGLANLCARAERLGGSCEMTSPVQDGAGTQVRWSVPTDGAGARPGPDAEDAQDAPRMESDGP